MALIAIDNGHGKETRGKHSPNDMGKPPLREWEFNRDVGHRVTAALVRCGVDAVRIVQEDKDVVLKERRERAQAEGAKVFISIHANAGGGTGIETFYAKGVYQSERLARLIQTQLIQDTAMRDRGLKTADLFVTRELPKVGIVPVLLELGFMDHPDDLAKLRDTAYRTTCAEAITKAVCRYLGVSYRPQ